MEKEEQFKLDLSNKSTFNSKLNSYGGADGFIAELEQTTSVFGTQNLVKEADHLLGVVPNSDLDTILVASREIDDRMVDAVSGYAHLLLAERMDENKYPKDEIGLEVDKAAALLHLAELGSKHPLIPRVMKLKRRIYKRQYTKLLIVIVLILILFVLLAYFGGQIRSGDFELL